MSKRILCGLVFLMVTGRAVQGYAAGDYIRFVQATSGIISALLVGSVDPCAGSIIFPMGTSSVSLDSNEFVITTSFVIADPPRCPWPPQPYEVSAALGTVTDGQYTVVWTVGSLVVHGGFGIESGQLQAGATPVPTLNFRTLFALLALVGGVGIAVRRSQARG